MSNYTASNAHSFYPTPDEINSWAESIRIESESIEYTAEFIGDSGFRCDSGDYYMNTNTIVKFTIKGMVPFYGLWSPVISGPAPLVVHLPGYGAELMTSNGVQQEGFNTLYLSPLGYWGPQGLNSENLPGGVRMVLPDTLTSDAKHGYRDWFLQVAVAVRWAWSQPQTLSDRVSFFGTSQGGGTSLLAGSIFSGHGTRCVACDEPFLTNFPLADFRCAYGIAKSTFDAMDDKGMAWHAMGMVDTISHIERINFPVMLTAGEIDEGCPPDTVKSLYEKLECTKMFYFLKNRNHGYNYEFLQLAKAWFRLYA